MEQALLQEWDSGVRVGENTRGIVRSMAAVLESLEDDAIDVRHAFQIDHARGDDLDRLGEQVGLRRSEGEDDDEFRTRVRVGYARAMADTTYDGVARILVTALDAESDDIIITVDEQTPTALIEVDTTFIDEANIHVEDLGEELRQSVPPGHNIAFLVEYSPDAVIELRDEAIVEDHAGDRSTIDVVTVAEVLDEPDGRSVAGIDTAWAIQDQLDGASEIGMDTASQIFFDEPDDVMWGDGRWGVDWYPEDFLARQQVFTVESEETYSYEQTVSDGELYDGDDDLYHFFTIEDGGSIDDGAGFTLTAGPDPYNVFIMEDNTRLQDGGILQLDNYTWLM